MIYNNAWRIVGHGSIVLFEPLNKIVDYPDALRGLIKSLETFDEDESVYFGGSNKINILLEYLKAQL